LHPVIFVGKWLVLNKYIVYVCVRAHQKNVLLLLLLLLLL
jgi:hypothetical protein